jgi:hypothetical protein
MWGAPYAWIASPCTTSDVIANEWEHQFSAVVGKDPGAISLLGFRPIYPDVLAYPDSNFTVWPHSIDGKGFPRCGEGLLDANGQVDTFRWFLDHYASPYDPASPWCGWLPKNPNWPIKEPTVPGIASQVATNTLWHFDSSLVHYPLGYFTGNHCDDGKKDFDETGVDSGAGSCPGTMPEVSLISPPDGGVVTGIYQVRASSYDAAYVEVYVDGQLVTTDAFAPYEYAWDTTQYLECSSHTVSARAIDWSGLSATALATVQVSNSNPPSCG